MTTCNGCGGCCDPVVLAHTQIEIRQMMPGELDPDDRRWMLEDLIRITPRAAHDKTEYQRPNDDMPTIAFDAKGDVVFWANFYRCRHFDEVERRCLNYDNRPPICSGYPWHGSRPRPDAALPFECSFRADIGQPVTIRGVDD